MGGKRSQTVCLSFHSWKDTGLRSRAEDVASAHLPACRLLHSHPRALVLPALHMPPSAPLYRPALQSWDPLINLIHHASMGLSSWFYSFLASELCPHLWIPSGAYARLPHKPSLSLRMHCFVIQECKAPNCAPTVTL